MSQKFVIITKLGYIINCNICFFVMLCKARWLFFVTMTGSKFHLKSSFEGYRKLANIKTFLSRLLLAWRYRDPIFRPLVRQSVKICVNPNFDPNVQDHIPRTITATVMLHGISLHLAMTPLAALSIFELDLVGSPTL